MPQRVLGIDLGTNSVGWALVEFEGKDAKRIVAAGVRAFEAGVKQDSGKEVPRNEERRNKRQQRRQLARRSRRLRTLALLLQRAGLLPDGDMTSESSRHAILLELDKSLKAKHAREADEERVGHLLPYLLRQRALDKPLEPHAVGRAIYHLAQRRGFLSNRKVQKEDEDESKVKASIVELQRRIEDSGSRTLGEYLAGLDPREERVRGRWTSRRMYEIEFDAIWDAQAAHHPQLMTEDHRVAIRHAIFFQRKLRNQKHLIGGCPYEAGRSRAPLALLDAQRMRYLQHLNNTRVITPDGEIMDLTPEQRAVLVDKLEYEGDLTFHKAVKTLGLTKASTFSFGAGDEDRFIGNRTGAKLAAVFGDRWRGFSDEQRDRIVEDLLTFENEHALAKRAQKAWGLDEDQAGKFAAVKLEPGYTRLSRQALAKLLPKLQDGMAYMTAVKEVYGTRREEVVHVTLPPLVEANDSLRNPTVMRSLTELRKVVNALVLEYGKPDIIRIELARDVKNTAKERKRIAKQNLDNRRARQDAAARITQETGNPHPSRADIEKVLLAQECEWRCPYTGKSISMRSLFGDAPQFDVEHIIPYSRCLDNSYMNKTLCDHEENRNVKRGKTPYEAYGRDPERWEAILARVRRFQGGARNGKLHRFRMEDLGSFEEFTTQQLNDTRYASREAVEYLGLLYGGAIDAEGHRRVQAGRGKVTADLRNAWRLNELLGDGGLKERSDHRHHAIDAVAIALTDAATIRKVSEAAGRVEQERGRKWWRFLEAPWNGFLDDVRKAIDGVVVSHRVSHKVSGPLHDESIYSPPREDERGDVYVCIRKRVEDLTSNEVNDIVDPAVRRRVIEALGDRTPDKAFGSIADQPTLPTRDGRFIPIHKVRIRKNLAAVALGQDHRLRHVVSGSNHHLEILESTGRKGEEKWEAEVVPLYVACDRVRRKEPVVKRDHGPGKRFVCSVAPGDSFVLRKDDSGDGTTIYVVRSVSKEKTGAIRVEFIDSRDARLKKDIKTSKAWRSKTPNELRKLGFRKVCVTPLGGVIPAHD